MPMMPPTAQPRLKNARRVITQQGKAPQGLRPLGGMQNQSPQQQQQWQGAQGQQNQANAPQNPQGPSAPSVPQGIGIKPPAGTSAIRFAAGPMRGPTKAPGTSYDNPNTAPAPPGSAAAENRYDPQPDPNDNEETGAKVDDFVRATLDAIDNVDTTEQEALIQQQINDRMQMDLMDQRASAGASGFEASGALIGMEGDIRRQANVDAVEQTLGARTEAQERAFDQAARAAGINIDYERFASDAAYREAQIEALNNWLVSQGAEPIGDPGAGGGPLGDPNALLDLDTYLPGLVSDDGSGRLPGMNEDPSNELANPDDGQATDEMFGAATEEDSEPDNHQGSYNYHDETGQGWQVYAMADGSYVKVRQDSYAIG